MEKQFHTYRSHIDSFRATECLLGIIKPGRYSGFDSFTLKSDSGTDIIVNMDHSTNSLRKSLNETPPLLGSYTGVIVTPQGQIIHNDDTNLTIAVAKNAGASERYDLVYCEHQFILSKGSNPAIYNVQKGIAGAGIPALANPEKRVLIATIKVGAGITTFSGLTFTVAKSPELGGLNHEQVLSLILGDYTSDNYIDANVSIIQNISNLDTALKNLDGDLEGLSNRKLDDWSLPDDNTDLDASTTRHGLLPKLSGNNAQVLRGDGTWGRLGNWVWTKRGLGYHDFHFSSMDNDLPLPLPNMEFAALDIIPIVPAGYSEILVNVTARVGGSGVVNPINEWGAINFYGSDQKTGFICSMLAPTSKLPEQRLSWQFYLPISNIPTLLINYIYYNFTNYFGETNVWFDSPNGLSELRVTILGYR